MSQFLNPLLKLLVFFLLKRENYDKYRSLVELDPKELKEIRFLYDTLDEFFQCSGSNVHLVETNRTEIPSSLQSYYRYAINETIKLKPSERELCRGLLQQMEEYSKSLERQSDEFGSLVVLVEKRSLATRIGELGFELAGAKEEDRSKVDKLTDLCNQLGQRFANNDISAGGHLKEVEDDLEELFNSTVKTPGLRWRLDCLNKSLGSIRKGDFGFLFARPETGKTTFLASESTYMASQTNGDILWFNNEEQGSKVKIRVYQAALGLNLHDLMSDRDGNHNDYLRATNGNIKIFDSSSIHRKDVERLCRSRNPRLIIFDQIDKIKGFVNEREDLRLGNIYQWARELAKEFAPVIGICQADGTAEGVKYLTMDHVSNAKTSKQAEADFIIGIGKSHDPNLEYIRHINISKNKLQGDADTLPELRHSRHDVFIEPEIARYKDII